MGIEQHHSKTIGRTPSEVLFGTYMNGEITPILSEITDETRENCETDFMRKEVKARIDSEQVKQKLAYDTGRRPAHTYNKGDLVKITKTCFTNDGQSKKLMPSFLGPYRVTKILGNDRYRVAPVPGLCSTQSRRPTTVAADRMKQWIHITALDLDENDSDDDQSN